MTAFSDAQDGLTRARAGREQAFEGYAAARAKVRQLEDELAQAKRSAADDRGTDALARDLKAARDDALLAKEELQGAVASEHGAFTTFVEFSDPRDRIGELSDRLPILLFPVRLETRFKTIAADGDAASHELWVRVFADTCSIDTFEPELAKAEVRSARSYWQEQWRAGGEEDARRAAWRSLAASHGSGRAEWILDHYRPLNEDDEPVKDVPGELVLVIGAEAAPRTDDARVLTSYWRAVWRADGDAAATQAARDELDGEVGAARAEELLARYEPFNLSDPPVPALDRPSTKVSVEFLLFPATTATASSWTRAPKVDLMPERFVLIATAGSTTVEQIGAPVASPLYVGPDPDAPPADSIRLEDGELVVPEQLAWLVDFDAAVELGMGFKVELTEEQAAAGFETVTVLGVRLGADAAAAQKQLEQLIEHHRTGRSGLSLIPQGTPTNNTESQSSGFSRSEDPDESYDSLAEGALFTPTTDWLTKSDGQRLGEALGIDPATLVRVPHGGGADQQDALAMNVALWPATLGYSLETMMNPVFGADTVEACREFFTRYVTGRGALPAFRVGSQPYGVLPTTAVSRLAWLDEGREDGAGFLARLYDVLRRLQAEWTTLTRSVSHVSASGGGDAHAGLLDILGLHPASVEFHSRYARSLHQIHNHLRLGGSDADLVKLIDGGGSGGGARALLAALGYDGAPPDLLSLVFQRRHALLDGGAVDDRPLSESASIREWTDDHRNYLEWLADTARLSLDDLRLEKGFTNGRPPGALLYLLARQALMLGYHDAGCEVRLSAGLASADEVRALKVEPKFIHVDDQASASESRWAPLYAPEPRIATSERPLWEYIAQALPEAAETGRLREQIEALELLAGASTARLERALAEHLDCCGYRLDAWLLGLVRLQLEEMRRQKGGTVTHVASGSSRGGIAHGIYLGAYGLLEDVRPKTSQLEAVELPPDLAEDFDAASAPPLVRDPSNGGFVHAPSLDHATTAAVLRSGFLANASPENPGTLAVNLSSRRVRLALSLLDGIRTGQSLGALLGYRLERGLHDRHGAIEVDSFIYALRKAFPLRADRIGDTASPPDTSIELVEARNVIDGLRLVEHVRDTGSSAYPFGLTTLPGAGAAERAAIDAEVDGLVDVYDAVADLALAEGVHQAARGNYDRVAATLDSYTKGHFPPEPEVVQTPTAGADLTHRVGLHLDPGAAAPAGATPRALAEPALNDWLGAILPALGDIFCVVEWDDPDGAAAGPATVTLDELGLEPVDVLYLVRTDDQHAMSELDDRIEWQVRGDEQPRLDAQLTVRYLVRRAGSVSLFELAPLVRALRSLVLRSRPLRATDVALPNEAGSKDDRDVDADRAGVAGVASNLDALQDELADLVSDLEPLLADQPNRRDDVVAGIDTFVDRAVPLLADAASYGMAQGGFGFALEWQRKAYAALIERLQERVTRFQTKLVEFQKALDDYDDLLAGIPEPELFSRLQGAEAKIRSKSSPLPQQPATLRQTVENERPQFEDKRDDLQAIVDGSVAGVSALFDAIDNAVAAPVPLADLDAQPFSLDDLREQTVAFAGELVAAAKSAADEAARRVKAADDHLIEHDAAAPGPGRFDALEAAAKALLGDDFRLLPRFRVRDERGTEWQQAHDASTGGELLDHLEQELKVLDPVDEWLAGVAPVREKMRAWQQAALHAGMFGTTEPELTPIQLPYRAGDSWLALQFPADYELDGDRVLYTAHYATQFAPGDEQCGLLIDEWTEVIPGDSHNTGIAFHFDRPSSEPPQALLLVTSPSWGAGSWAWDDLVGAVAETFELARLRAVEPRQLDATSFASFLPAVIMAAALRDITIGTVLAANDRVLEAIQLG